MAVTNYTPIDNLVAKSQPNFFTPLPSKEMEPVYSNEGQKEVKMTVERKEMDEELKPVVQIRQETAEIPPDLQQMGVNATPTAQFQTPQVHAPISDDQIVQGLHQPVSSSFRWLAELALYILKHAHIVLKTVHGKVTRVALKN